MEGGGPVVAVAKVFISIVTVPMAHLTLQTGVTVVGVCDVCRQSYFEDYGEESATVDDGALPWRG